MLTIRDSIDSDNVLPVHCPQECRSCEQTTPYILIYATFEDVQIVERSLFAPLSSTPPRDLSRLIGEIGGGSPSWQLGERVCIAALFASVRLSMLIAGTLAIDCGWPRESALFSQVGWVAGEYSSYSRVAPHAVQSRVVE